MPENILVRGVNWIGDAVMTMPAIHALKKIFPDSRLTLLVRPSVASLFEKDPFIDEIILYEEKFRGYIGKLKLAQLLRGRSFTKAVLLQNAFDAALITSLAGIPERIGYNRDGRGFLLTNPVPFNKEDRKFHHTEYYLNIISALSPLSSALSPLPWIYLSPEERLIARGKLSGLKRPVLGINPGATYGSAKRWFPERFAEIASWFIKDTGGSVVVFGGLAETEIAEEICKKIEVGENHCDAAQPRNFSISQLINLAGKTSLRELCALISECEVLVSNDSGPMHVAYAVGTPLVAIFGSTCPNLTGPTGEDDIVIKSDLLCSPCFERTCKNKDLKCMHGITSEDVYRGIKKILPDKKAVFFDRDGTLCRDANYLSRWEDFEVFPDVKNLGLLKEKGFRLIGISNQSGIARGIIEESFAKEVNQTFIDRYCFDAFYYCPHHPADHCPCRKPEPAMLFEARARHRIDLKKSYVVGDKDADMMLAKAVGAKGILVLTGQQKRSAHADITVKGLKSAVDFIIRDSA